MTKQHHQALLDATAGIRETYIEEAASPPIRRTWLIYAAAAAALVVLLSAVLWPAQPQPGSEPVPFFAIQAYAADGTAKILDDIGESVVIASGKSSLYPDKNVYSFYISLGDYTGDPADFEEGEFIFRENGKFLQPGEIGEEIAVEWLRSEDHGISGYRVTGWCEDRDWIDITIEDKNGTVLHQKELWVEKEAENYRITARISYTYRDDMTTDELIDEVLRQNYIDKTFCSTFEMMYHFVRRDTGFLILEQRPDAAEKLLERFIAHRLEYEALHGPPSGLTMGWFDPQFNTDVLASMLTYDVYWNQLTQEQQELYCTHGGWRAPEGMSRWFPGKYVFTWALDPQYGHRIEVTVSYGDQTIPHGGATDHVRLLETSIVGWFTEPTELTITVTDRQGGFLYEEVLLITPAGKTYDIEVLEKAE